MNFENAIEVHDITKRFRVYMDKGRTLKEIALFSKRRKYEEREVLKGISFEVKKGEAIGLIGHNGCGKSTMLKLLTKIMYPDSGTIEMKGRVSSLIELGAGFHPDMSGRQNIYTNASIFGLTRKEIDERIGDIIAFSELEEFIDNPVRTYSSGMYMRLAFSVAINVDADILLIDEILAVGDANFQAKCFDWLRELKASGVTIVIVSHDTGTIERFCNKAIWIDNGYAVKYDSAPKVVDAYLKHMNERKIESLQRQSEKVQNKEKIIPIKVPNEIKREDGNSEKAIKDIDEKSKIDYSANHFGLGHVVIEKAQLKNAESQVTNVLRGGECFEIEIYYKVNKPLEEYVFGMGIYTLDGNCLMGTNMQIDHVNMPHKKMNGVVKCRIEKLALLTGKYVLNVAVVDKDGTPLDFYRDYLHFDVVTDDRSIGFVKLSRKWEVM